MSEQGIRNRLSQCPFQILQCDSEGLIGAGTGFFYEHDGQSFLITNWHIISGVSPSTKTAMHPQGRTPEHLQVKFFTIAADGIHASSIAQRVDIHDADGPKWYEHPDLGSDCDVVALPFARPTNCPPLFHTPANRLSPEKVPVMPGSTAFVVGYPLALSVGPGFPLLKSGYIASEPTFGVRIGGKLSPVGGMACVPDLPAFFLDSQTRQGMSGSPVFTVYTGIWNPLDPYAPSDESGNFHLTGSTTIGQGREFVGCYSGRVGASEHEAALGLCWRVDAIEAICSAKRRGQNPH